MSSTETYIRIPGTFLLKTNYAGPLVTSEKFVGPGQGRTMDLVEILREVDGKHGVSWFSVG